MLKAYKHHNIPRTNNVPRSSNVAFSSFQISPLEQEIAEEVKIALFHYHFLKEACSLSANQLVDLKTFCGMSLGNRIPEAQSSNVV